MIRALNEGQHLGRLLEGLEKQSRAVNEVILVDSGSTDDTVEIAKNHGCRIVTIDKRDFSFGRALNYGCEAASGDVIILLSAHVYPVYDSYVQNIVKPLETTKATLVYGRQIGDHRTKLSERRIMKKWFPAGNVRAQSHPFCNNANAATLASTWNEFRYDESLTGLEDLDYAKRLSESGCEIGYAGDAPIVHVHEESWSQITNRYRREAIAHKRIYPAKQMSGPHAARLAAVNIVADWMEALREGEFVSNASDVVRFRSSQFYGTWQGFRDPRPTHEQLMRRYYYPAELVDRGAPDGIGTPIEYETRS